jgi:hypothetical protein
VVTVRSGEPPVASQPAAAGAAPWTTAGPHEAMVQPKSVGLNAVGSTRTSQFPETSRITASTP